MTVRIWNEEKNSHYGIARRMGWLCDRVIKVGGFAIADFICPTVATRKAF